MRLKYTFEQVDLGEEIIYVPVGKGAEYVHGILKVNDAGKTIIELLREENSVESIISTLSDTFENEPTELSSYVKKVIGILQNVGLIEE